MKTGVKRDRRSRGSTLIEMMIVVVLLGVLAVAFMDSRLLSRPGVSGTDALRVEEATELLVELQQEALATPYAELAREAETGTGPEGRRVEEIGPGLLKITLEVSWGRAWERTPEERRILTMVTLRGDGR